MGLFVALFFQIIIIIFLMICIVAAKLLALYIYHNLKYSLLVYVFQSFLLQLTSFPDLTQPPPWIFI